MATIYQRTPKLIAQLPEVQEAIWERTFEIAARAEELLVAHRYEGIAQVDIAKGDIDAYVVLEDTNVTNASGGANSAASIEFGRNGYNVQVVNDQGEVVSEYTVAPAEGLHILEDASRLPRKQRPVHVAKTVKIKASKFYRNRSGGRG
ncbi:DUF5403 family protein [Streptomyces sp. NRRL F-5123]|uniref:DUF5403 family protein n=1 Tax=Streptomyces sp. NRRL F-5123 TaxID=1463856 RepID=UPI0004E0F291|nr:DUF5403 family protein [Streptomyces sp. NRRL F-5123]